jgi:hypothetical protein
MNEHIQKIRVTIQQMKRLLNGLEGIAEELPNDPELHALLADAPLEHLSRLIHELERYFAELKQVAEVTVA